MRDRVIYVAQTLLLSKQSSLLKALRTKSVGSKGGACETICRSFADSAASEGPQPGKLLLPPPTPRLARLESCLCRKSDPNILMV